MKRRSEGAAPADEGSACLAEEITDLRSRLGDGGTQAVQPGDRHGSVLLRSLQSIAAGQQREHERALAPVLPEGPRCFWVHVGPAKRGVEN